VRRRKRRFVRALSEGHLFTCERRHMFQLHSRTV
jgi:hypothetical protein